MEWLRDVPVLERERGVSRVEIVEWHPRFAGHFRRLNEAWISRYFELEPDDLRTLGDPAGEIIARGGAIVFALAGGQVVGTGALVHEDEGVYELAKMAVDPAWQGRGIGQLVAERLLSIARSRGARKVELVSQTDLAAAIRLYERLGFRRVPLGKAAYKRANVRMEVGLAGKGTAVSTA